MEKNNMTAVEWFIKELNQELNYIPITQWDRIRDLVQRAKQMEKEQIMDDFMAGKWDWAEHMKGKESKDPAEYYNERYGTK